MVFIFVVICLLTVDLHQRAKGSSVAVQEHQLIMPTTSGSDQILFWEPFSRVTSPDLVSFSPEWWAHGKEKIDIEAYLRQLKKVHVKAVSVLEQHGIVVESTDQKSQGLDFGSRDFFLWEKKRKTKEKLCFILIFQPSTLPFWRFSSSRPSIKDLRTSSIPSRVEIVGALLLKIDFEEFLSEH